MKDLLNKKNKYREAMIPAIIVVITILIAYACKGIIPFGGRRVDYFDNMQQVAPLYTHLWDFLHFKVPLFYDPYSGLGTSVSMSISAFSMLSPFNLLLYLIPSNVILPFIAYLNLVKLSFAAFSMYLFLNYANEKLDVKNKVILSTVFALCGYASMYSPVFTPWMDIFAIMPLAMLGLLKLLKENKKLLFISMVALMFIINYYLAAMTLVYCLFFAGVYLIFISKSKIKSTFSLIVSTVLGVGISSFILLPVFLQLKSSQRNAENSGIKDEYFEIIKKTFFEEGALSTFQRFMMLFAMTSILAIIVIGIIRGIKKKERDVIFYIIISLIALSPIVVQGTNTMWHFGSYFGYTLRMGYLIPFTLIFVAARYVQEITQKDEKNKINKKIITTNVIIAGILLALYVIFYKNIDIKDEVFAIIIFGAIEIIVFLIYLILISSIKIAKKTFKLIYIFPFILLELFICFYMFLGVPVFFKAAPFQNGSYVEVANDLKDKFNIETSQTQRIKNGDLSLNANYPLILRKSALSTFTAAIDDGTQRAASAFGYSQYFLWLLDSGGTVFSDALFSIHQDISIRYVDDNIASQVKNSGGYKLYNLRYTFPYAMPIKDENLKDLQKNLNQVVAFNEKNKEHKYANSFTKYEKTNTRLSNEWIVVQNAFYKALSNDNEDLITIPKINDLKKEEADNKQILTFNFNTNKSSKEVVYMALRNVKEPYEDVSNTPFNKSTEIFVNNSKIITSTIGDARNTEGVNDFNNNLINLGTFKDEKISVKIVFDNYYSYENMQLSLGNLNLEKMANLSKKLSEFNYNLKESYNKISIDIKNNIENESILVPMILSKDTKIFLNGKEAKASMVANLFTAISLEAGENHIVITHRQSGFKKGILLSAIALITTVIYLVLSRKKRRLPKFIQIISAIIFYGVLTGVVLVILVIPTIFAIMSF